jgi:hypothetical protein
MYLVQIVMYFVEIFMLILKYLCISYEHKCRQKNIVHVDDTRAVKEDGSYHS